MKFGGVRKEDDLIPGRKLVEVPEHLTQRVVVSIENDISAFARVPTAVVVSGGVRRWIPDIKNCPVCQFLQLWFRLLDGDVQTDRRDRQARGRRGWRGGGRQRRGCQRRQQGG